MVLVYDIHLSSRAFQVQSLVTPMWILLRCTTYKILYMCKILVPAVRFGACFKVYSSCCCSLWSSSLKRCLKTNVACCFKNVAWISMDEFWMPSWVTQMLNGFQICIKNHVSQGILGYSVCCGEGCVWKANKLVIQICFLLYTLDYMCEVRKQVQGPRQCFSTKTIVHFRIRLSKEVLKYILRLKCTRVCWELLHLTEFDLWHVGPAEPRLTLSVITINVVQ